MPHFQPLLVNRGHKRPECVSQNTSLYMPSTLLCRSYRFSARLQLNNQYTGSITSLGLCRLLQEDRNYQPGWVWHMLNSRWGDEAVTAYSTAKAAEQQAAHQQASSALAAQQHAAQQSALQQQARCRMAQQQRAQGWANNWMTPERALHYA